MHINCNVIYSIRSIEFFAANQLKRDFIPLSEVKRFIVDCFVAVKTPKRHGELMADLLIAADYRGHFSHGMNRLEMYLNDIKADAMDAAAEPTVLKVIIQGKFGEKYFQCNLNALQIPL